MRPVVNTWTEDEDARLRRLWTDGVLGVNIARMIGRSVGAVSYRAEKIGLVARYLLGPRPRGRVMNVEPSKQRKCLACGKTFDTERRYFVCAECKAQPAWRMGGTGFVTDCGVGVRRK